MTCYHPQTAFLLNFNGKKKMFFGDNPPASGGGFSTKINVPCGQCIGCRLAHSKEWAIRCMHESKMHESSYFLTLTYDNEHLPVDMSLDRPHFTRFLKRLRKRFGSFRYFACGEYGEINLRPHYHAIIFGIDFPDKVIHSRSRNLTLWRSPALEELWQDGFSTIGSVTFESCAYVARYVTKKVNGSQKSEHYGDRSPEFSAMSLKPGIGYSFLVKYLDDIYNTDTVILRNNMKCKPPRYYDKCLELIDPERYSLIKSQRLQYLLDNPDSGTLDDSLRLSQRHDFKLAQFKQLVRKLEV